MYDPLHDKFPGVDEKYPRSYWATVSGEVPDSFSTLREDIDADVVIIGAGYTGLSCAYHLAKYHQIHPIVVEANQIAWGCSGRNAGFVLKSSGRKPYSQMLSEWGEEVMRGIYDEMSEGVATVNHLIDQGIDCDKQENGYIKIAHKPSEFEKLKKTAQLQQKMFGYDVELLSQETLALNYMDDKNAYGAIRYNDGFGVNPLKLAWGYQKLAQQAGAKIYTGTPVTQWDNSLGLLANRHILRTPKGNITAKKVVIATNGYTPKNFHVLTDKRTLPVLSQIIVTEPLTHEQLRSCNLLTTNVVMDTRALKYYYRKLPDNRILFGGRGAISGKQAEDPYYANRLLSVLKTSFPSLHDIQYQFAWSGWVCMSLDDIPHVYQNKNETIFYSMGYCGSGLSFSVQAGKRMAEKVAEKSVPNLPIYQQALPEFPLAPLRRLGQWGYFQYGRVKDRWF